MNMNTFHVKSADRGYSLLEVLVALLVISVSLLGVAGMQAISISNTGVAAFRSVAAMKASSLSASMSANEAYWQGAGVATATTVNGSTITSTDANITGSPTCASSTCTAASMATYDLKTWGGELQSSLPGGTGKVNCTVTGTSPNAVNTCQIIVYWVEKNVAQNQSSGASATAGTQYDFEMVIQP